MTRISPVGQLSSGQLQILRQINTLSQELDRSAQRLATQRRILSSRDDPAGLIAAVRLESEREAAEKVQSGMARIDARLAAADAAAGEIVTQLQRARSLALEAAGGSLSSAETAAHQVEIDAILSAVSRFAGTTFNGAALLDGSQGFRARGYGSTVLDVDVLHKAASGDVTVSVQITTAAARAANTYTGGTLSADLSLVLTGPQGSATITLASGATVNQIETAIDNVSSTTGITAAVDSGNVVLTSNDYGSAATISIEVLEGSFTTSGGASVSGTDAVATINGQQVTAEGSRFRYHSAELSLVLELSPTATGTLTPFTITGKGFTVPLSGNPGSTTRFGLSDLRPTSLGGVHGRLDTLRSEGDHSLTADAANAVRILDEAISEVNLARSTIGSFQSYTLDSASRIQDVVVEQTSRTLSEIRDADVAEEMSRQTSLQLQMQMAFNALSISRLRQESVVLLLQ